MDLNGKRVDLEQLKAEATAAGVAVADLGTAGDELITWDGDGHTIDVPPTMQPVVDAHVPPPRPIDFAGIRSVSAVVATTTASVLEVFRFPCDPKRQYQATLKISGIDRGNFASLVQLGEFVWKRNTAGAIMAGITVVSSIPTTPPAGWATNAFASGNDIVFTVQGPSGRTLDWYLRGDVEVYAPEGL